MRSIRRHEALVRRGNTLHVATVPTVSPKAGGLLIAPSFVGVCGTDLQIVNGTRPDTAEIQGHEGAGVVVEAGKGAPMREGDSVVFNPSVQIPAGRILGHNIPGLFQRYVSVDAQEIHDGLVIPMKADLPPICGAIVEPLGGVIYEHELMSRVIPDLRSVVIFGAGPVGLLTAEYLTEMGARVLLVHTSSVRLNTAVELNLVTAASVLTVSEDLPERILAWNDGKRLDASVICTSIPGAPMALRHAVEVLKDNGCVEMVTNYPDPSPTPQGITAAAIKAVRAANVCGVPAEGKYFTAEIAGRRIVFAGHRGTSEDHLVRAMRVLKSKASRYTTLITHVLSLQDAAAAIQTLASSRGASINGRDCIKAVVDLSNGPAQVASRL